MAICGSTDVRVRGQQIIQADAASQPGLILVLGGTNKEHHMTDSISVSGPVAVKSDSNARVAYELMSYISGWESAPEAEKRTREYWLKLYWQCYQAADGSSLSHVLQSK